MGHHPGVSISVQVPQDAESPCLGREPPSSLCSPSHSHAPMQDFGLFGPKGKLITQLGWLLSGIRGSGLNLAVQG